MNEEMIINDFKDKLEKFIASIVKDQNAVGDILQDALLKIYVALPKLKNREKLTSWVYQITRNTVNDYFRKQHLKVELVDLPDNPTVDDSLNHELTNCLKPFIDQLPEKYRDALNQTDLGKLSQKEYAKKIGLSYSGAKSNVQRARVKLKELFKQCCHIEADKYGQIMAYQQKSLAAAPDFCVFF